MKKRFLSLLMIFIILIVSSVGTVSAMTSSVNTRFYVSSVNANASSIAKVDVKIENNPGVLGAILSVDYDDGLVLTDAQNGDAFNMLALTVPGAYKSPSVFSWDGIDIDSSQAEDGTILSLYFKVPSNAPAGKKYSVNVSVKAGDIVDSNLNTVNVSTSGGYITVGNAAVDPTGDTTIAVANVSAVAGDRVNVDVSVMSNPGILGAILSLNYPSELNLVEVNNGDAFSALALTASGVYQSPCQFSWDGIDLAPSDIKDGTILNLVFEVPSNAQPGSVYNLELSYKAGNIIDKDFNAVNPVVSNGSITVENSQCTHNYVPNTVQPTCTENGYIVYKCDLCDDEYVVYPDELVSTGHTPADAVRENAVDVTCETEGSYDSVVYCSKCNEELSRETIIVQPQHVFELFDGYDPDCENDGFYIYQCSLCGEVYYEDVDALGHDYTILPAKEATCTEDGLTEGKSCARCGIVVSTQKVIPALGHNMVLDRSTVTCEKNGLMVYKCERCSKLETVKQNALGHDYQFVEYADGKLVYVCQDCNKENKMTQDEVIIIWDNIYLNTVPQRGSYNQFLDVAKDNFVNAKDYAMLKHAFN